MDLQEQLKPGIWDFLGLCVSHLCCFLHVSFILFCRRPVPHGRTRGCWQLLCFTFYGFHTGQEFSFSVSVKKILGRDSDWPFLAQDQWPRVWGQLRQYYASKVFTETWKRNRMISITQCQLCTFKTYTYIRHYILLKDTDISKYIFQTY